MKCTFLQRTRSSQASYFFLHKLCEVSKILNKVFNSTKIVS